jgi:hypothetical protein
MTALQPRRSGEMSNCEKWLPVVRLAIIQLFWRVRVHVGQQLDTIGAPASAFPRQIGQSGSLGPPKFRDPFTICFAAHPKDDGAIHKGVGQLPDGGDRNGRPCAERSRFMIIAIAPQDPTRLLVSGVEHSAELVVLTEEGVSFVHQQGWSIGFDDTKQDACCDARDRQRPANETRQNGERRRFPASLGGGKDG